NPPSGPDMIALSQEILTKMEAHKQPKRRIRIRAGYLRHTGVTRLSHRVEHRLELAGQRRLDALAGDAHRGAVQEGAIEPVLGREVAIGLGIAVAIVAQDRMADGREMAADLVGATGLEAHV